MKKILDFARTYRRELTWTVLGFNVLAGAANLLIANIDQSILHITIVILAAVDLSDDPNKQ